MFLLILVVADPVSVIDSGYSNQFAVEAAFSVIV